MRLLSSWRVIASPMLILGLIASDSALAANSLKVVIDPGHGGKDHGAQSENKKESEITMAVSEKLAQRLERDRRFQPIMTRTSDEFLSLSERVRRAEQAKGDLFLSVHVNWSQDPRAQGFEVYFQNQLPSDEESMYLAARENQEEHNTIHTPTNSEVASNLAPEIHLIIKDLARNQRIYASSQLAKQLKSAWRGTKKSKAQSVRQAPFFVISNLPIPSALVEIGFLSHAIEGPRLSLDSYQDDMAKSLHEGLIRYHESLDKPPGPRLQ